MHKSTVCDVPNYASISLPHPTLFVHVHQISNIISKDSFQHFSSFLLSILTETFWFESALVGNIMVH